MSSSGLSLPTPPPSSSDDDEEEVVEYTPETPFITELQQSKQVGVDYDVVFDVNESTKFGASFEIPMAIVPTAEAMTEIYLPDVLLDKWIQCTNAYAASILPPGKTRDITRPDILRFLAIIQYMGVVRLPAKHDYFPGKRSDVLPTHPSIELNRTLFDYLWRYFHTTFTSGRGPDETIEGITEDDENQLDQDEDDDVVVEDEDEEEDE